MSDKDLTLEQEFEKRKSDHKSQIIMYVLIRLSHTIYDSKYFKEYKDMPIEQVEGYENKFDDIQLRAFQVESDIENRDKSGEKGLYNRVYEFCWKKARNLMVENIVVY